MIKAIALDDEPLALRIIEIFCHQTDGIILEKTFTAQNDALKYLRNYPVDLLFLDIQMPKRNGLDFFKNLEYKPAVIFTTAFSEFAVEGFNVSATDYLLKPFTIERFTQAVNKVKSELAFRKSAVIQDFMLIRADFKLHKINFSDIVYIEGLDDYIQIHLTDKPKIVAKCAMKSVLEKLPETEFVRIHRSFIVPINRIKSVTGKSVLIDEISLPIGETYKDFLEKWK